MFPAAVAARSVRRLTAGCVGCGAEFTAACQAVPFDLEETIYGQSQEKKSGSEKKRQQKKQARGESGPTGQEEKNGRQQAGNEEASFRQSHGATRKIRGRRIGSSTGCHGTGCVAGRMAVSDGRQALTPIR